MVVAEVIVVCFEKFFLWRYVYVRFFTRKIIIDIKIGMNLMEIIKLREDILISNDIKGVEHI